MDIFNIFLSTGTPSVYIGKALDNPVKPHMDIVKTLDIPAAPQMKIVKILALLHLKIDIVNTLLSPVSPPIVKS